MRSQELKRAAGDKMGENFTYDVAFSFLAIDEGIAAQLHTKLKGRLSSFYYAEAERQELIAGRDGDEVYGRIFGEETRTVVVLYRAEWGESGFTQIESTAIRNRGFDHGHEFLTLINRDGSPLPRWLPRSRVWVGLDKYGLDHAVTVIESRVQEAGGEPHEETAIARAERMQTERLLESERQAFVDSQDGADAAMSGCREIFDRIKVISTQSHGQIREPKRLSSPRFTFELESNCDYWKLSVVWNQWASNTTAKADLVVREWYGSITSMAQPKRSTSFEFDYRDELAGWRQKPAESRFYRHDEVADWIANRLLTRIEERRASPRDHD